MKREQIIRAWKDEAYRLSLSDEERAMLPENPAGSIELLDAQLEGVSGGRAIIGRYTILCSIDCQSLACF